MNVRYLWRMSRTRRWHTYDGVTQNLADHSYGILLLILRLHPNPSIDLLRAAAYHDLSEGVSGDIPADFKWQNPEVAKTLRQANTDIEIKWKIRVPLTIEDQLWLKVCDLLEALMFCDHQIKLGNSYFEEPRGRIKEALGDLTLPPQLNRLLEEIDVSK